MPANFQYGVFLSHNRQDNPRVRRLAQKLRDAGLCVWYDEWAIEPGECESMLRESLAFEVTDAIRSKGGNDENKNVGGFTVD